MNIMEYMTPKKETECVTWWVYVSGPSRRRRHRRRTSSQWQCHSHWPSGGW